MPDPETPTQPLIRAASQQTAVDVGAPGQGAGSSRAYKIAGLTLLACVLIVGQATIAYFLLSQRGDLKALQEQNDKLKTDLKNGRSASVPMRMHMPTNALSDLVDTSVEEESSTGAPEKPATDCQLAAAGLKPQQVPGFLPVCDKHGLYEPQQCFMGECWCVNPMSGQPVPGVTEQGAVSCRAAVFAGGLGTALTMPEIEA